MTIVVWTPEAMAADRLSTRGDTNYYLRKLWRVGNEVIGLAGGSDYCVALLAWFQAGAKLEDWPRWQDKDDYAIALVARQGKCFLYDRTPHPIEILQDFCAIGSGREVALGALSQGASAVDAVASAIIWTNTCGGAIDREALV